MLHIFLVKINSVFFSYALSLVISQFVSLRTSWSFLPFFCGVPSLFFLSFLGSEASLHKMFSSQASKGRGTYVNQIPFESRGGGGAWKNFNSDTRVGGGVKCFSHDFFDENSDFNEIH